MTLPLTTPCAHNFCKLCLLKSYSDQSFIRERTCGGRTLRAQKVVKKCPSCSNDISDFLQNPQVNREVMDLIESLQKKIEEENVGDTTGEESDVVEKTEEVGSDDDKAEEGEEDENEDDEDGTGSDVLEEKEMTADNQTANVERTDDQHLQLKHEAANGDSEVHAENSELEESGEGDCQSPARKATRTSRKRQQTSGGKRAIKKAKNAK